MLSFKYIPEIYCDLISRYHLSFDLTVHPLSDHTKDIFSPFYGRGHVERSQYVPFHIRRAFTLSILAKLKSYAKISRNPNILQHICMFLLSVALCSLKNLTLVSCRWVASHQDLFFLSLSTTETWANRSCTYNKYTMNKW